MAVYKRDDVWWIDYYVNGRRKRERIGTNYKLAQQILAKRKVQIAEGKYLEIKAADDMQMSKLVDLYLEHTKDKKKSYRRDQLSAKYIKEFFTTRRVNEISAAFIENYRSNRKRVNTRYETKPKPATINRELAFLKRVFSWGMQNGLISQNPAKYVKMDKENNVRDRVLSEKEFEALLQASPAHLKPILIMAYYTAMRKSEILNLTWDQVDMDKGFVFLRPEDTKTNEGRRIPLHPEVLKVLNELPETAKITYVFIYHGKQIKDIKTAFKTACIEAGIEEFRFHDFRHTAITNWRRMGHDHITIMAASGHKTFSVFKRYNTVSEDDLKGLVRG